MPLLSCKKLSALNHYRIQLGKIRKYFLSTSLCLNDREKGKGKPAGKKYADTINLPQMPYALSVYKPDGRCNERESYIQKIADFDGLYKWQRRNNKAPQFTIHDGPPYANGQPHVGHALNKIIKDVINRYKVLRGHQVHFVPGWDCHGLPIETKARSANDFSLTDIQVRKQADKFSRETLATQRDEFKTWGVMADWDNPYITSDRHFVAKELDIFQQLYNKGLIYQDYMPVYWSPSSRTALAEAELEYNNNHKSLSVYVKLSCTHLPHSLKVHLREERPVYLVIWTTTPWTLPANQAVCYSPGLQYCLVKWEKTGDHLIVARDLIDNLSTKLSHALDIVATFTGETLADVKYTHPTSGDEQRPLLPASHVTADVGTGLVHTAPAHGHDDFKVALQHDLSKECIIDEHGLYMSSAGKYFAGKNVFEEGNSLVLKMLGERVIHSEDYIHKYPYDWRSKQPVMIRASSQWFINTKSLVQPAISALEEVTVLPGVYKTPLCETISHRPYWCISRQRAWGVPIPVFYDQYERAYVNSVLTDHVKKLMIEQGPDCWWEADMDTLLPDHIKSEAGLDKSLTYRRGKDILDIWFDSGITWAAVLDSAPADLYIEGVDQIRGWFQSSLLTSVALTGQSPYKCLMMHGFTVDENNQKMSKSLGNVVAPSDVIYGSKTEQKGYGIDVLRWWAASKYSVTNVDIGPAIIKQCNEKLLLLRKRMRFILGNLYDFHSVDILQYEELLPQDQYFLHQLHQYAAKITLLYDRYEMSSVLNELEMFMTKFSSIYSTLSKDRLYCFPVTSRERRSAQTTLHHTLEVILRSFAPILPFFAEDCYMHRYGNQLNLHSESSTTPSIFRSGWFKEIPCWSNTELADKFEFVYSLADKIRCLLENTPTDAFEYIFVTSSENDAYKILMELQEDCGDEELSSHTPLCEVMQCASVRVCLAHDINLSELEYTHHTESLEHGVTVYVRETSCYRCERCRRYTATSATEPCEMCLLNMADTWAG